MNRRRKKKKKKKKSSEVLEQPAMVIAKKYVPTNVLKQASKDFQFFKPAQEEVVAISLTEMRGLYKAKCRDQQLPVVRTREQRFFELIYKTCSGLNFSLKEHGLGAQSAIALVKVLGRNRKYSLLDLSGNRFRDQGTISLAPLFKMNDTIVRADFRSNDIGSRGAEALFYALCHNKTLTSLDLSGLSGINRNHIGIKGAVALKQLLSTPTSVICHLNLASNGLGVEGIRMLCEGIKVNRCIEYFNISSNNIGSNGCDYLIDILDRNNLSTLIIERNSIGDRGITLLANALRNASHPSISFIDLSYNKIGKNGVKEFCEMLKLDTRISTVKLDGNVIGNEGARHIASMLEVNKYIRNISIAKNEIDDVGCKSIGISLEENVGLRSLNLSSNYISDISQLCSSLSGSGVGEEKSFKNDVLQNLDVSNNRIDNVGGRCIPLMLRKNNSLRHLSIKRNDMRDFEKIRTPSASAARKRAKQKKKRLKIESRRRKMSSSGIQKQKDRSFGNDDPDEGKDIYEFYFSGSHLTKRQKEINDSFERLYQDSKQRRSGQNIKKIKSSVKKTSKGYKGDPGSSGRPVYVSQGELGGIFEMGGLTREEKASHMNSSLGTKMSNSMKGNTVILSLDYSYNNFCCETVWNILGVLKRNKKLYKRSQKMELRRKIVTMEMREEDLKSTMKSIKEETSAMVGVEEQFKTHLVEQKRISVETKGYMIKFEEDINQLTKERRIIERDYEELMIKLQGQEKDFRISCKKYDDRINTERERLGKYDNIIYELEKEEREAKQKFRVEHIELYNDIREAEGEVENDVISLKNLQDSLEEEGQKRILLKQSYREYIEMKRKQKRSRRGRRGGRGRGRGRGRGGTTSQSTSPRVRGGRGRGRGGSAAGRGRGGLEGRGRGGSPRVFRGGRGIRGASNRERNLSTRSTRSTRSKRSSGDKKMMSKKKNNNNNGE